jgi:hypothetical protein
LQEGRKHDVECGVSAPLSWRPRNQERRLAPHSTSSRVRLDENNALNFMAPLLAERLEPSE